MEALSITPDWSIEERATLRKLVKEIKNKIKTEPSKYHFIWDQKIMSDDNA